MAHDVFISYSSHDKQIADAVCSALENSRIRCWVAPRDILPGKEWGEAIVEAIGNSKVMVLIFSASSNRSQQVLREVERAVNKNVVIVPFRIEDVLPTKSMEYFLYSTHWLDALTPDVEEHITMLVEITGKLLANAHSADTTSKPFVKVPAQQPAKPEAKGQKITMVILAVLLAAFGLFGIWSAFFKPNERIAVHQPTASVSPLPASGTQTAAEAPQTATATPSATSETISGNVAEPSGEENTPVQNDGVNTTAQNAEPTREPAPSGPSQPSSPGDDKAATPKPIPRETKTKLKTGQVIQFGNYYAKPIKWTVIHISSDAKPLLLSTDILTLKPFDASESGTYNKTGDIAFDNKMPRADVYKTYKPEDLRAMKGSNSWADSNIRQWLNSDQKQVGYTTQSPSSPAVWFGYNDYDKEPGFLYNFTDTEKAMIHKVKHTSVLSLMEKEKAAGGNELYDFSRASLQDAWYNLHSAYYAYVEDKVFLLSVEEALTYLYDRGQLLNAYLTDEAIRRDESSWYNDLKHEANGSFMWWLRTPNANTPCEVCTVSVTGDIIYSDYAVLCGVGVRPACYLNAVELDLTGSGTEEDPFVLKTDE